VANWIKFNLSGADKLQADLQNKTSQLQQALSTRVNALLFQLETKLKMKIRSVLKMRTGHLVGAVRVLEQATPEKISGGVGIPQGVATHDYGTIHELGHAGSYKITATAKKALAWQLSTKAKGMAFAKYVTHPPIPALHYTSTTAEENREWVLEELQNTVNEVLKKK
jgi:hypothetical protein